MPHIFITDSDYGSIDITFKYLLGFQPSLGGIVLSSDNIVVFLDSRYFLKTKTINKENIKKIIGKKDLVIEFIEFDFGNTGMIEKIIEFISSYKQITLENNIAVKYAKKIKEKYRGKIKYNENYFGEKRIIKTKEEVNKIKKAIWIIDEVFLYIQEINKKGELFGKTELEIRNLIIIKILELGGTGESFDSIVAFGKNSAIPHHNSGNTKIGNGVLLIDMGAVFEGYCSDFTRTFWVGKKEDNYNKFKKIYKIVKDAHNLAIKKFNLGIHGKDLDKISRDYIKESGYGEYYTHGLGHGLGLQIHEKPGINKISKEKIKESMVFTIEPGIYLEGEFGVRLEDIVFVEDGELKKYSKIEL